MGFRYRRSVKLMAGVRLNVGKRGFSVSVGKRGATVNLSKRGVRTTVGLPGTGISYTTNSRWTSDSAPPQSHLAQGTDAAQPTSNLAALFWLLAIVVALVAAAASSR
jgi:hypothetical protein